MFIFSYSSSLSSQWQFGFVVAVVVMGAVVVAGRELLLLAGSCHLGGVVM